MTISEFAFEELPVRFLTVGNTVWCLLEDLYRVLNRTDLADILKNLDRHIQLQTISTANGSQKLLCINCEGIKILTTTLASALATRFYTWLVSNVIPQLLLDTDRVSAPELTTAMAAIDRASSILRSVGVEPQQMAMWLLRQYSRFDATYIDIYQDACQLIAGLSPAVNSAIDAPSVSTEVPSPEKTFIPTEIGQLLAERYSHIVHPPSAQKVNQALQELKLQVRDDQKLWRLTTLGKQYGRIVSITDHKGRKRPQISWFPSVLEQLLPWFEVV